MKNTVKTKEKPVKSLQKQSDIIKRSNAIIAELSGVDKEKINPDSNFFKEKESGGLGMSTTNFAKLIQRFQNEFSINIEAGYVLGISQVMNLTGYLIQNT